MRMRMALDRAEKGAGRGALRRRLQDCWRDGGVGGRASRRVKHDCQYQWTLDQYSELPHTAELLWLEEKNLGRGGVAAGAP